MWKISYFLLLLIACDNCSTYESTGLKAAEPTRSNRNYKNRRYQLDDDEANYEDNYNTPEESEEYEGGRLIGRWRNNGEAIEPKWRDGDSIPLVPFEEAATRRKPTAKPKEKLSNNGDDIINHASSTNKYQEMQDEYNKKMPMNTPTSDIKSMPQFVPPSKEMRNYGREELHEPSHHIDYANVPRNGSRRYRTRKQKPLELPAEKAHPAISYEREPVQHTTSHNINPKTDGNIDTGRVRFDTHNYQNPLQIHVHDYELNDEEYHRPRSRKRRPPQNYEYVETKTPYPSLDFWQKSSDSSTTSQTRDTKSQNTPNEGQKQSEHSELKSLLKMQQVEGLSLSEILQRRNLTLGDLLKGKIEIINALKINDDEETSLHAVTEKKSIPVQSTTHSRTSSERPKWVTHRRVRIKELRRNPVQVTPSHKNIRKDITDNTNNKINETRELSLLDNEGKSRNNKNFSTAMNQTKPIISPRLDSTRTKPVIITTTTSTTTTTTIKSTVKDPVMQYDSEKHSTTPQSNDDEEIMEFSDFAEKKYRGSSSVSMPIPSTTIVEPESTTISGRGSMVIAKYNDIDRDLGSTLSIEHILFTEPTTISTLTTTINEHDDDNKSNTLIEYDGMENDADPYDEMEYQNDGPGNEEHRNINDELMGQMSVNLPESTKMQEKNRLTTIGNMDESVPSNHRPPSPHNKIYDMVISEIEPQARAEIFELISSGASAHRLEELLKSRNMSIDELISLRQRGSSRVHLADIPRLRTRSRKHKTRGDQMFARTRIPETERSELISTTLPADLNPEENSSPLSIYSTLDDINEHVNKINDTKRRFIVVDKTPIIIRISSRTGKDDKSVTNRKDPGELVDILSAFDSLPFTVYNNDPVTTSSESTTMANNGETVSQTIKYNLEVVTKQPDITTELGIGLIEEIARETERNGEQLFSTTDESYAFIPTFEDEKKTLSKVRPSIIASGAILGMTIVGFLAIFIVCRIRQKQKYMYKNTFSKAVFQAPVMNARKLSNSSSLNTIMVNVVATSTTKRSMKQETQEIEENFEVKSDIDNDSLDANDSWDTIPDFMK